MAADVLVSERPADKVRLLTLNRPDRLNAITAELCGALHEELDSVAADRSCRAVVLTGAGRGFCAGLDLGGYGDAPGNDGSDTARDRLANQEHMSRLVVRLRETPQPIIAAVNGPAAGFGLALALGSDIRYAARSASSSTTSATSPIRSASSASTRRPVSMSSCDREAPTSRGSNQLTAMSQFDTPMFTNATRKTALCAA